MTGSEGHIVFELLNFICALFNATRGICTKTQELADNTAGRQFEMAVNVEKNCGIKSSHMDDVSGETNEKCSVSLKTFKKEGEKGWDMN